ncbi:thioredoxin domain-containing protein [Geomonas sp.]|uniref:thioredoxin domain-containing protein n=1 Tax=Geomonas sp. TaxID=2651584 RepID=UPI002B499926|nr:thioredoxin domain-containing protein [Geomonas sp.]HJV35023.1 thioredoxin domain-containing protein [Geomonas sp.]
MDRSVEDRYLELPGCADLPAPPRERFEEARLRRGSSYHPRTRHLLPDGFARYTNRLFLETSPYLLQHAHNPVNWFAWGDEPFDLARRLDRPLLVSIGYATCHWCHVMEEESFEDEEIARFLNENFIAVKVDREERPDVDSVYMTSLHAMGSQGGWPLNVFLTPDRLPFYGGTYFPPFDHSRGMGFLTLLQRLLEAYRADRQRIARAGEQLSEAVRSMLAPESGEASLSGSLPDQAVRSLRPAFDMVNGGLQGAPKFPSSLPLRLLFRSARRNKDRELTAMAALTLRQMAAGGIYDQVGGGFHRYATDQQWLIPHFEKMLYDNALLTISYLEGYQQLGGPDLAAVAKETLRYLMRDMAAPEGAFYAATDADSRAANGKMEEGYFFTWTPEELTDVLGRERGQLVAGLYGMTEEGNFEGRSILHKVKSIPELARGAGLPEERVRSLLEESREMLYQARSRRPPPLRDEKILSAWNGLAISAFARGGMVLDDVELVNQARRTATFILVKMMPEGRLAHSHQGGQPKGEGFLDDYAFLIGGLIDLFEASGEAHWLEQALSLTAIVEGEFQDQEGGGYFMTGSRHEELIAREKPAYDGVVPSGNSVMIMNLLRLHALTEQARYLEEANRTVAAFSSRLSSSPAALSEMLLALDFLNDVPRQVVVVAPRGDRQAAEGLLREFQRHFIPNRTLVVLCEGEQLDRAARLIPLLREKKANGDQAVAYLCENRSCGMPTSDPAELRRQLS